MTANRKAWLVLLSVVALCVFNFPILGILAQDTTPGRMPILYVYIFVLWFLVIAGTFWLNHRKDV
ncbi:MAG: hypothetical protein D6772_12195 [Bacteroidetes bacterium]|nr:MAG: hypothetical protein D6772_12195 [Bacteroidota bacterium]